MRSRLSWKLRSYLGKDVRPQVLCKAYPKNLQKRINSQTMTWGRHALVFFVQRQPRIWMPNQNHHDHLANDSNFVFEYQLYNRMSKNWWLKTEKACNTNLKYLTLHSWSKKHDDCFVRFCCWWWQVWNSFKKEIEIVFGVNNGWKWRKAALHVTRPRPQDHTTAMFEVWPNMKYTWRRAPRMI